MMTNYLEEYLNSNRVAHRWVHHRPAYSAQETAAAAHVSGKQFAKTVIVSLDGRLAMVVVRADERVDMPKLREAAGVQEGRIVSEQEFSDRFPECETGAMPPFGHLYGMPVYVSKQLAEDEEISFNGGSHTELVSLAYSDYVRLEHPRVMAFAA
jgi:Ala-tRNA(Pro) deacylase